MCDLSNAGLTDHHREPLRIVAGQILRWHQKRKNTAHIRYSCLPLADVQFLIQYAILLKCVTTEQTFVRSHGAFGNQSSKEEADCSGNCTIYGTFQQFHLFLLLLYPLTDLTVLNQRVLSFIKQNQQTSNQCTQALQHHVQHAVCQSNVDISRQLDAVHHH